MKVFFTTAIINYFYEKRKIEYLESYNIIKEIVNTNDIYIIECYGSGNTFLDNISKNVFYTNTETPLRNKGVKEALGILKFMSCNNFDDEEIIIKITGRYKFKSDFFIKNVKNEYDAFVKKGDNDQIFFGCFAIKYKYFKQFFNTIDLQQMERNMINIEQEFSIFLKNNKINCFVFDNIDVFSNINNISPTHW